MKPILFAEDSDDDVFLLKRALRRVTLPNPVSFVYNGRDAIAHLTSGQPAPGCAILDVKMPFRSGLEVLGWIRGQPRWEELVVLMMTSSAQDQDIDEAYRLGADAYLVKPAGSDELDRMVSQLKAAILTPRGDPIWQGFGCSRPPPPFRQPPK